MKLPFSEKIDGLPVWRLQVDDPAKAVEAKLELASQALRFPQGGVLALCLKLYEGNRPLLFHHAVAFGSLELGALRQHPAILLIFEHKGWNSDERKALPTAFASLPELPEGSEALAPYLSAYRAQQSAAGPEAAWAAIERSLSAPAVKAGSRVWVKFLLGCVGAAAAALAYYLWVVTN